MVYYETGKFKRDTVNRGGKPTKTVRVTGLSVNSKFKNDGDLIIMAKPDFTELVAQMGNSNENLDELETQLSNSEERVKELEAQLMEVNTKLETLENTTPEPAPESPKYVNKVIDLQEEINNRNQLLLNTQNVINSIFTEVNQNQHESLSNVIGLISKLQSRAKSILDYGEEVRTQKDNINDEFKKVSWFKWIRSKNKINIILDLDKLNELEAEIVKFTNADIVELANSVITPMEIPTDTLDLNKLYISTIDDDTTNEFVIDLGNDPQN